jgi:hypothetical protein
VAVLARAWSAVAQAAVRVAFANVRTIYDRAQHNKAIILQAM